MFKMRSFSSHTLRKEVKLHLQQGQIHVNRIKLHPKPDFYHSFALFFQQLKRKGNSRTHDCKKDRSQKASHHPRLHKQNNIDIKMDCSCGGGWVEGWSLQGGVSSEVHK